MFEPQDAGAPETRRKRAPKACLACRTRKVRCDVVHRGAPCLNCYLDKRECVVKPRVKKYRGRDSIASVSSPNAGQSAGAESEQSSMDRQLGQSPGHRRPSQSNHTGAFLQGLNDHMDTGHRTDSEYQSNPSTENSSSQGRTNGHSRRNSEWEQITNLGPSKTEMHLESQAIVNTHIMFSYYPFIKLGAMSKLSAEDVNFLEAQGCFRVPTRPALDELVREYFLHVQPLLPFLNEREFWSIYPDNEPRKAPRISLFVLQAMLFAASNFVSVETVQKLGFKNNRSAKLSYFRRAKLLFDFEAEYDAVSLAQGSLLLTYHQPMTAQKRSNSHWLATAIQSAKDLEAHQYHSTPNLSPERRNMLKRLWWCCIIRDRILPLGTRRSIMITSFDFDFSTAPLSTADFQDELNHSKVYDAATKGAVVQLSVCMCELVVQLTDAILLLYPCNGLRDLHSTSNQNIFQSIATCKQKLISWFEKATVICSTLGSSGGASDSVSLYSNLIFVYYHDAMMALAHREVLISVTHEPDTSASANWIFQSKQEIEAAMSGMTDHLKEIVQLKLSKYMPISVVAFAALPLVIHLLEVKLARSEYQKAKKQRKLNIYTEAMRILQSQYEVTDSVSDTISKMIEHISLENDPNLDFNTPEQIVQEPSPTAVSDNSVVSSWGDVFLRQPILYLRLTFTVDLYLSKGRFPLDSEFPLALQSKVRSGKRFPQYRINLSDMRRQSVVSNYDSMATGIHTNAYIPSSQLAANQNQALMGPIDLVGMDFESPDFEIPMGFEAFDIDLFNRRGVEFDYPAAWALDPGIHDNRNI